MKKKKDSSYMHDLNHGSLNIPLELVMFILVFIIAFCLFGVFYPNKFEDKVDTNKTEIKQERNIL